MAIIVQRIVDGQISTRKQKIEERRHSPSTRPKATAIVRKVIFGWLISVTTANIIKKDVILKKKL